MLEELAGRVVSGAVWGVGAAVALQLTGKKDGAKSLRPIAKSLVRAGIVVSEKARYFAAEARESIEDLYAEAQLEREQAEQQQKPESPSRRRPSRRAASQEAPQPINISKE